MEPQMERGDNSKQVRMSEPEQLVYVSDQVREVEHLHRDLLTDGVRRLPIRDHTRAILT